MVQDNHVMVHQVRIENFQRIRLAQATFDAKGGFHRLGGLNKAGKTSFMRGLMVAFCGKRAMPKEPVRRGAKSASFFVDCGDFRIESSITEAGTYKVDVITADGKRPPLKQEFLDQFYNSLSFDPFAFTKMESKKQAEALRLLVGLDLSTFDAKIKAVEDERTLVGREVTALEGQAAACVYHKDAPAEPVSATQLMDELQEAQELNSAADAMAAKARQAVQDNKEYIKDVTAIVARETEEIAELEHKLARIKASRDANVKSIEQAKAKSQALQGKLNHALEAPRVDVEPIRIRIGQVDQINAKVNANRQRTKVMSDLAAKKSQYTSMSEKVDAARKAKVDALAKVDLPVEGLSFDDAGVYLNGLPLESASDGEKIEVSTAIWFASRPKLGMMLVRNASLLDNATMAHIANEARRRKVDVIAELVARQDADGNIIETDADGFIRDGLMEVSFVDDFAEVA